MQDQSGILIPTELYFLKKLSIDYFHKIIKRVEQTGLVFKQIKLVLFKAERVLIFKAEMQENNLFLVCRVSANLKTILG